MFDESQVIISITGMIFFLYINNTKNKIYNMYECEMIIIDV